MRKRPEGWGNGTETSVARVSFRLCIVCMDGDGVSRMGNPHLVNLPNREIRDSLKLFIMFGY